jgi:hypothetical protein
MKLYRVGGCGVSVVMFAMSVLLTPSSKAQTNSWTSSTSGNWEDSSSWSLGQPPGAGQSILLTNAGFKAVQLRATTATDSPPTLAVDSITISSPTNSLNTLLMNFVGVDSPLVVNSLTLGANSDFTMHSSALLVQSNLSIGGTFNQNDFSGVTAANMQIGDLGPAQYTMSNGTLTVTNLEYIGSSNNYPVNFDQEGGFHLATQLWLTNGAIYDLNNGQLGGDIRIQHGILIQNGGDLALNDFPIQGSYTLTDGTLEAPGTMSLTDNAFVGQWGGTNTAGSLVMGTTSQENLGVGIYTLVDGTMNLGSATINYLGGLDQQGGAINVGTLNIPDFLFGPDVHSVWGNFSQEGGLLSAGTINLAGHIVQSGGTNTVAGNLNLQDGPADYIMNGGFLSASNTLKTGGAFHQTNGIHSVQNLLQIDNPLAYDMIGGQLIAPFIQIDNSTFAHYGGDVSNSAVLLMNFGWWIERSPSVQLGRLRLAGSGFPSTLSIATNPCTIHFIGSSGQVWSNNVTLQIGGWSGSITGGGQSQIYFGNNSSGLSASQLAHVQFTFAQGNLPAKILPSGEVVPLITGLPFFPTDLTATAFGSNRIELGWTDNALNEYGYDIERSLDGTNFVQICATEANVTNYSDTEVAAATTYYYRVRALTTNGVSDFSNIAAATTLAPLTATLSAQADGGMQLNFSGPAQHSYEIDISSDLAYWVPWTTQFTETGTVSITDPSATNSPSRYYRITMLP